MGFEYRVPYIDSSGNSSLISTNWVQTPEIQGIYEEMRKMRKEIDELHSIISSLDIKKKNKQ